MGEATAGLKDNASTSSRAVAQSVTTRPGPAFWPLDGEAGLQILEESRHSSHHPGRGIGDDHLQSTQAEAQNAHASLPVLIHLPPESDKAETTTLQTPCSNTAMTARTRRAWTAEGSSWHRSCARGHGHPWNHETGATPRLSPRFGMDRHPRLGVVSKKINGPLPDPE